MKKILIFSCLIILFLGTILFYRKDPLSPHLTVNNKKILLELAVTSSEIEKGLSGRKNLKPYHGMLFLFNHKEQYQFWMGGMNFPLDFIWIDGNLIVEITKNVLPLVHGNIPRITPLVPVDKVLEINAGEADRIGLRVGDTILFNK